LKPSVIVLASIAALTLSCGVAGGQQSGAGPERDGQPRYGGQLNWATQVDPDDWDITTRGGSGDNWHGISLSHNSLLGFKMGPDVEFLETTLVPELAERWELSPDGRAFTFHLRKGAKFANVPPVNGREFNAGDVKWTVEYYSRTGEFKDKKLPAATRGFIFQGLEGVETPDASTAVIRFKDPYVPFANYAASRWFPILAKEVYQQDGHLKDRMAGTGPFILDTTATQKGTRWVWKKNPSYMNGGRPYLDAIRDVILPDDSTAAAAFTTGQIDMTDAAMPVRDAEELAKKDPSAIAHLYLEATAKEMYLNPARPPLNDVRVRKAILYAMDRDELVKVRTDGKGAWAMAGGLVSTFTQDEVKKMIPYDVEQAKRLLREAGFPNGLDIQFEYPTDRGGDEIAEAELLQSQLKKAGINLVLKGMPYAQYSTMKKNKEHVMNVTNRSYGGDIDYALYRIFHPKSKNAYDSIDDAKLVQMLEAQRRETNLEKREQIVREAVKYINVDIALGRALYHNALYQLWKPYVKNYAPHKGHRSHYMTETWLDK